MHIKVNVDKLPEPRLPPTLPFRTPPALTKILFKEEAAEQWSGHERNTGPFTPDEDDKILQMLRDGFTTHQISVELDRYIGTVMARINYLKKLKKVV